MAVEQWGPPTNLADRHRVILEASAITPERMALWRSVERPEELPAGLATWGKKAVPCMATEWRTISGRRVPQVRVDNPVPDKNGRPRRYLFEEDSGGIVGVDEAFEDRWADPNTPALLVEGTKQFQAAASTIPPAAPFAIPFGIAGCWGWSQEFKPSADLRAMPVEGRDVYVAFDADITTNWMVWEAARRLERYLTGELLARSVRFVINPGVGGAKDGLDDLLGRQEGQERRIRSLRHLIDTAIEHKQIKPAPKKPSRKTGFFDGANFMPASCLDYLRSEHHLAMSGDQSVAVYHRGVYWNGISLWWTRLITDTLQNDYKPEFENSVTKMALAWLKTEERSIPFQQKEPVINFRNGLLDARSLELRDHTHEHLTLVQWPWEWDPKAECPVFLKWIEAVAPGQLESLLDVCSQMLDLSQWPGLIVFLTGPTRSGKSTLIRILCSLVGPALRSNVSLHDLSSGKDLFASSSLFGKVLNTFADLSANDLQDLSLIKVLTGGDEFEAQRKNNHRFTMRNQAMLVFSANSVPAASEQSNALLTRVAHFEFPNSFAGAEDPTIEKQILENELPGVLRLLVGALHKRRQRGRFLPLDKDRQRAFAEKTDRVRMFLAESTRPGDRSRQCILKSALFQKYRLWVIDNLGDKAIPLGKWKFNERVRLSGVELFTPKGGSETWNLLPAGGENTDTEPSKPPTGGQTADNELTAANGEGLAVRESAVSEPKTQTKTTDPRTADGEAVLEDSKAPSSVKSAVHPYFPPSQKKEKKVAETLQWVETTETPDRDKNQRAPDQPLVGDADPQQLILGGDPIQPANPMPFVGEPPTGIDYICRAVDLPDPDGMALSLGFDLETFNRRTDLWRHKASLSPSLGGEIRLAQLTGADSKTTLVIDVAVIGQPAVDWLRALVRNPNRTLVGHNLLFEATFLIAAGIRPLCKWWDTMLACQIIGDLPSNSLAAASAHYLKQELDKTEQTSDWGNGLTASQLRYAALDAVVVLPLGRELHKQLHETKQVEVHRVDCSMISACADGQVRGLAVDVPAAIASQKRATAERKALAAELHQTLNLENYRNPLKLKEALAQHLGEEIEDTKDRTLKKFRPDPVIEQLLQLKTLDQELKEVKWLLEEADLTDGRVRPCYRLIGASTGRMSTSALIRDTNSHVPSDTERFKTGKRKGEPKPVKLGQCGFNFQGITGDRKLALGTGNPDTVLMDLDWSSIEIRLQASPELYNDDGQRRILLDGIDPHAYIASQACGREITKADPERSTIGKMANFSLAYGCGVAGLRTLLSRARGTRVTESEARKVYEAWHQFHPQISRQMRQFDSGTTLEVRSLLGRRMTYRDHTAGADGIRPMRPLGRTNGINFPIQGSGRDLLAAALGDLWPALDPFPGVHIVGLIHDEILLEVPRDLVDQVREIALASMTSQKLQKQYLGDIPLEADCNVAETWGEAH